MDPKAFHRSLTVVDGHCDTVLDLLGISYAEQAMERRDFFERGARGQLDLPRLVEGGVTCQVMALFTDNAYVSEAAAHSWRLLEAVESLWERSPQFARATKASDIEAAKAGGRVAGLLGIEGGDALGGGSGEASGPAAEEALSSLRAFHDRGVRILTLAWSRPNALAMGVSAPERPQLPGGLSPLGRRVVAEMERLGMVVDASHLSDASLKDLLAVAQRPVVASHSNCRALVPNRRNLTDAQAEGIAATGGLIGLTFAGCFIDSDPAKVTKERFFEHLEHMITVVGPDHVGLGSDFDGFSPAMGLAFSSPAELPWLTGRLLEAGHQPADVAKIMGGNWMRVFREILG
jgi:membrane dipeptidase